MNDIWELYRFLREMKWIYEDGVLWVYGLFNLGGC